jgi:hypothetical protein
MKWRMLLLSIVLSLVVVACAPPPELRDDSFLNDTSLLSGEPCEAPCWRNITPGETSWRDARIIIEDDTTLVDYQEETSPDTDARIANFNTLDGGTQCCRLYSLDGETVTAILTLLAPEMRLGEVLDKFGEPAYLTGDDVTAEQTLVSLVFPDVPLVTYVFGAGVAEGELSTQSEIIGAIYLSAEEMDTLLATTNLYNWEGYAPLGQYLDGEFDLVPDLTTNVDETTDADATDGETTDSDASDE